ncbi:thioredoxin domain-containing protein 12-like [Macrosteles quadrilineatus]|uniref:thioredoxin domain-containing protein 12-like n=1 Tax=Macrosteles quadrilineatus TaxID=74068 RepID=UPI0023E0EB0A|nr:thioredoxin domain-containing protein 12-like [Macrosteles quadrilineatus]
MKISPEGIFFCLSWMVFKVKASENLLARGFGDHIPWHNLDDALNEAKNNNLPIMLIIHKTWCGACKSLKPKFAESKEIEELSKHFIMVNVEDNEEPKGKSYSPDGGYIPRILFLNSEGDVQTEFYNENGNPQYKYFYPDAESIVKMMKKVSDEISTKPRPIADEL